MLQDIHFTIQHGHGVAMVHGAVGQPVLFQVVTPDRLKPRLLQTAQVIPTISTMYIAQAMVGVMVLRTIT